MKAANIILILTLSVFFVSEFSFCDTAKAGDNDEHCARCCFLVCCAAIVLSSPLLTDSNTDSRILYLQLPLPQSSPSKGLERPPRTTQR